MLVLVIESRIIAILPHDGAEFLTGTVLLPVRIIISPTPPAFKSSCFSVDVVASCTGGIHGSDFVMILRIINFKFSPIYELMKFNPNIIYIQFIILWIKIFLI